MVGLQRTLRRWEPVDTSTGEIGVEHRFVVEEFCHEAIRFIQEHATWFSKEDHTKRKDIASSNAMS
jgi:hypothetical protein